MSTTLRPSAFWRRSGCHEKAYSDAGLFGQILLQAFLEMLLSTRGSARPNLGVQRTRSRHVALVVASEPLMVEVHERRRLPRATQAQTIAIREGSSVRGNGSRRRRDPPPAAASLLGPSVLTAPWA
jgi:hypothetical protein